ncbi:hypothetical protein LXA43DRAFT_1095822 [Ganoderma leucocontextum]|nr:hypothetical protein LXA43DRAFT_1095822 [Ganoderma leucocontextum]
MFWGDECIGDLIPKGFIAAVTEWAYSRDSRVYIDPEAFIPEPFLTAGRLNSSYVTLRRLPSDMAVGYALAILLRGGTPLHRHFHRRSAGPLDERGSQMCLMARKTMQGLFSCVIQALAQN